MVFLQSLILTTLLVPPALSESIAEFEDISLRSEIIFDTCSFHLALKSRPGRCTGGSVDQCFCMSLSEGLLVDCSNRNMTTIPNLIPRRTTVLLLNHNNIKEVPDNVFGSNSKLIHLDLSYNNISVLMNNSFYQLHELRTLLLQNNRLRYTENSLPAIGFHHLEKLVCLRIEQRGMISDVEDYPIQSLMPLKNLQVLFMDGLPNRTFSKNFSLFTSLVTIVLNGITGRCNLTSVTNGSFVFLSHIENLALLNCSLTSIQKGSFEEMKNLLSLNLSYNTELHFQSMVNVTYGLTKLSRFRSLNFTKIHSTFGRCTYLDSQMLQYFNQTTMQELILDSNRLSTVDADALDFFPKNLSYISVANNKFDIGSYLINLLCNCDGIFPNIRTFIMSNQNWRKAISGLLLKEWSKRNPYLNQKTKKNINWFTRPSSNVISFKKCYSHILKKCPDCLNIHTSPCPLPIVGEFNLCPIPLLLPPYLETIDISGSHYRISVEQVCLCPNNSLTNLNLKRNLVYSFPGPFYGFEQLKTLDLAENYCNNITEASFENMPNLRTLNLSSNLLGDCINNKTSMLPFKNQQKLTYLDLSNNKLRTLPRDVFYNLTSLEYLSLAKNKMSKIKVNIAKLTKIKVLDLSRNLLETISEDVRIVLDFARKHNNATVNMTHNKFTCICKYQRFIEWMTQNRKMFIGFDDYYCHFDNGDRHYMTDSIVVNRLQKDCTNYIPLILGTSLSFALVIFILVSVISYRYRWHIRYMYYSAKFRYNGYARVDDDDDSFLYDIFVSYADADKHFVLEQMVPELEGKRQLRLLVHERDFPFGKLVTENIHQAISSSRRTMLVVSPSFLSSKWCIYEMNIAKVEGINRDREVLCVVMKDSIPISNLPLDLMDIIAKRTYLNVPTDPELFTGFWDSIETLTH